MDKGIMFLGIGFELVMMCLGGAYLGTYIDKKMGWNNTATAVLVILLLISWFVHLIFLIQRFEKNDADPKNPPKS